MGGRGRRLGPPRTDSGAGRRARPRRSQAQRYWASAVGFLVFFVLLVLLDRVFPGHARWAVVAAALAAWGAVTLAPRLEAGLRRWWLWSRDTPATAIRF